MELKPGVLKILLLLLVFMPAALFSQEKFSFAFFTDIHLNRGTGKSFEGFKKALSLAKEKNIDFIITGGDNVDTDVIKEENSETAVGLYEEYAEIIKNYGIPFYVTIGNHDRFHASDTSNIHLNDDGMFRKYFKEAYYSFEHKGWKIIVLNSVETENGAYPVAGTEQINWLKKLLKQTPFTQPFIIVTHVPFLSVYYPVLKGNYTDMDIMKNQHEVLNLFKNHNLKLVLQGHMHIYEEIKVKGINFITGGAVSAAWWNGPYYGTEEGFLYLELEKNDVKWEYIDYGWDAINKQ